MQQKPRNPPPGWKEVLDALLEINGDPELLAAVKDALLRLLVRSIAERSIGFIDERLECLKPYGVVNHQGGLRGRYYYPVSNSNIKRTRTDWIEAIDLAKALDFLKRQMGSDPAVQNFLHQLKVLFWHKNGQDLAERCRVVFSYGNSSYRISMIWFMILGRYQPFEGSFIRLASQEFSRRCQGLVSRNESGCHPSIKSGDLNIFVLRALGSKRPLTLADFWGIIAWGRIDFLEFLMVDLPVKRLPYSVEDLIFIAMKYGGTTLKILQLIEKVSPGAIARVSDQYGGNLLWYALFSLSRKPAVDGSGTIILPPVLSFLYDFCDHEKKICDGFSFDDLIRNYPFKFLENCQFK